MDASRKVSGTGSTKRLSAKLNGDCQPNENKDAAKKVKYNQNDMPHWK